MPDDQSAAYTPHIPEAVRRAAELADQLSRDATQAAREASGDNPEGSNQDDAATTVVDRPDGRDSGTQQGTLPLGDNPQPAQEPVRDEWEQRYHTLQGKYNTEVPELRGELRSLRDL